jgi:thiol:disulfide interchange protein
MSQFQLLLNIFFAFLGGLVMNFMPCILPLISLKISSFLGFSNERATYLKKNTLYILGILSFFFGLGILLAFFKFTGKNFIFGSHMQSGGFLFIIFSILTLIGFNLAGLFEFEIHSLTNKSSNFLFKFSGFIAEYLNGLLVSLLAVPCTAPFIASAFTFALGTNYLNIFLITFFMGLGFSSPFILAIIFPGQILKIIPKPGLWMEKFKNLMAFPIFGASAWILFVLIKQNNIFFSALCLFFVILSYFSIWFWKNFFVDGGGKKIIKLLILGWVFICAYLIFPSIKDCSQEKKIIKSKKESYQLNFGEKQEFSGEKLEYFKSLKQRILIVASASWCLTCHINEKNALASEDFFKTLKEQKILYLYIDLTNTNSEGENFLQEKKQVGIPFYLTIDSSGKENRWAQLLKPQKVLEDLKALL